MGRQAGIRDLDEDEEPYFEPEKGNVVFASAMDGWGFRISHFAKLYAAKLGANADTLTQAMWGDFAFNAKTKRIIKIKPEQQHKLTPLFVQVRLCLRKQTHQSGNSKISDLTTKT